MNKITAEGIGLALALLLMVGGITFFAERAQAPTTPAAAPHTGNVVLSIQGLYAGKQVAIADGETVLALLQQENAADASVQLKIKAYAGLGTLVVGMGALQNGAGGKYWQYKVDNVMPQIGANDYHLKNGDTVEWIFAASQE